ncbi:hypothetical protein QBC38DRAFT_491227 [Podospora fimiseda]|uniref:Uncharacterized protein n=1 Tax=Podospora fimiseda TaxID=252190 RepID=A0AAN6YPN6_9PEZI|nr:hypothetical protein QBC38DRAFT_491227 [Podospora fimiseda]
MVTHMILSHRRLLRLFRRFSPLYFSSSFPSSISTKHTIFVLPRINQELSLKTSFKQAQKLPLFVIPTFDNMSPTEPQKPMNPEGIQVPKTAHVHELQTVQPPAPPAMNPQKPHPENESMMGLRGGDRSSCCPGRFCFCVPCPLPCDCCII